MIQRVPASVVGGHVSIWLKILDTVFKDLHSSIFLKTFWDFTGYMWAPTLVIRTHIMKLIFYTGEFLKGKKDRVAQN